MPEPLVWSVRLWERAPQKRWVAIVAMVVAGAAGTVLLHHLLFGLVGVLVVLVSTGELFFPAKYTLDANEARQRIGITVTAIRWTDVKRLIPQQDGVRLSPFEKPDRLDAFRGVFLRYASNEDAVLGKIRELWQGDASTLERRADGRAEDGARGEGGPGSPQTPVGDSGDPLP
ncbi:MAG: hypothetical protein JST30_12290 [Armatimonadetes bacterium]|nr:hypothetical protein [Armatimonadota bacterium]